MPRQPISRSIAGIAFAAGLLIAGCESPTLPPARVFAPPSVQLVTPEPEGRFRQNDPTLSCLLHSARGSGFRVAFDWKDVPGATRYRLVFWQRNAEFPAIEREISESEYEQINCNAFVIDPNLNEWVWKVAALGPIPTTESDTGASVRDTILWSEERVFGFEPCRLLDGRGCYAPAEPFSDISAFVATQRLPSVRAILPAFSTPDSGLVLFRVLYGPPQDCPSGCFYANAWGMRYRGRSGWLDVESTYLLSQTSQLVYFDVLPQDDVLFSETLQQQLEQDKTNSILVQFNLRIRLLLSRDSDAADSALVMLARRLPQDGWPYLGYLLVEAGKTRANRTLLEVLASLGASAWDYSDTRDRARAALNALTQS